MDIQNNIILEKSELNGTHHHQQTWMWEILGIRRSAADVFVILEHGVTSVGIRCLMFCDHYITLEYHAPIIQ